MNNKYLEHVEVMLEKAAFIIDETFCPLSLEQLNWKPNKKTWSIAECIDHLNITTTLYFGVFDDIKNNNLKTSIWTKIPFWSNWVGRFLLKTVDPETKKKSNTTQIFKPKQSNYTRDILVHFADFQKQLLIYLHQLDGYDHSGITIPSPLNAMFAYKLEDAFTILWKHQIRHYNQAKNLMTLENFPTS